MLDTDILAGMDVNVKSQTKNKIEYIIANPDRFASKELIEQRLKTAKMSFKDGVKSSTSIDIRTTDVVISNVLYRLYYKPRAGGGSGAGAEITALGECFQAYASAARQIKRRDLESADEVFSILDDSKIRLTVDADRTLKQCKEKLDPMWLYSGQAIANELSSYLGAGEYTFHRGSSEVKKIEDLYKKLKKVAGISFDINKWNPADIWAIKKNFNLKTDFKTLTDFNQYLYEQHTNKNLVGVSLKKLSSTISKPVQEIYNSKAAKKKAKFISYRINAKGKEFFSDSLSKDVYITFEEGRSRKEMQFRTFSAGMSGWQGEIKGSSAAGGKIGGGNLETALELAGIASSKFYDQAAFRPKARSKDEKTLKEFTTFYKYLSGDKRSEKVLLPEIQILVKSFDHNWFYSKYLGMQFLYLMHSNNKQDDVISTLVSIASSSTPISSIFVKYS